MVSFIVGLIGAIIGLVGWFAFHSVLLLIVGTALYIVETIMEWKELNAGAKLVDVIVFIIGSVIGVITKSPFYIGGMVAINIYSGVMAIISLIPFLSFFL